VFVILLHSIVTFLLGVVVGSFTGVVVEREGKEESWFFSRSRCDSCRKTIAWYDNIPVLSYLILRGKCRWCQSPIPRRYPVIELLMGLLFVFFYYLNAPPVYFVLLWALVAISLVDLRFGLIPDSVLVLSGLLLIILKGLALENILVGLAVAGFFTFLVLVTRGRGMGWGDVKLAFWMGLWLGWIVIIAVWLAFLTGAIAGIILILVKKKTWGQTVPFGPFLCWGALVAIFAGKMLVEAFLGAV
jgi:leader peptidase (prepilin peptidase)/N-methyltransferase